MLTHLSKAEQVRNETLIHRAEGDALNRLSQYYGFNRPEIIKDQYWQLALREAVYGARGTLGLLLIFLKNLFKEYSTFSTYDMEVVDYNTLRYTGSVPLCQLEHRYVFIEGQPYFTHYSDGNLLHLSLTNSTYWRAADLSAYTGQTLKVEILPYLIKEVDGYVDLQVDSGLFTIPATYLRSNAEARDNEPEGGHIMDYFSQLTDERFGDQENGAYPVYFNVDEFFSRYFDVITNILAAGIVFRVESKRWCGDEPSIYGSLTTLIKYGTASPTPVAVTPSRT